MKERILIVAPNPSTFAVRDVRLLSGDYAVSFALNPVQKKVRALLSLPFFAVKVILSDAVITWFADSSKFPVRLAKMFGKKTVVMIGGYDVAKIESIGYGALLDNGKVKDVKWTLEHADVVVSVDQGLIDDIIDHFGRDFGAIVVPTGYDPSVYRPEGPKAHLVLSVCYAANRRGLVKGIDVYAECARRMPDVRFRLIGVTGDAVKELGAIPANLEVLGGIPAEQVIGHYQKAKVYCQLSMREGLPNAVCEAMLCGCTVVGSDVQGVRTAVGDRGYLVPYGDVEKTCGAIEKALLAPDLGGREWISLNFSEAKRKIRLNDIIAGLLGERNRRCE